MDQIARDFATKVHAVMVCYDLSIKPGDGAREFIFGSRDFADSLAEELRKAGYQRVESGTHTVDLDNPFSHN